MLLELRPVLFSTTVSKAKSIAIIEEAFSEDEGVRWSVIIRWQYQHPSPLKIVPWSLQIAFSHRSSRCKMIWMFDELHYFESTATLISTN